MMHWIGDIWFYAEDKKELFDTLEEFFCVCGEIGLKVHAEKSHLFSTEANFVAVSFQQKEYSITHDTSNH